ncbi:MAG: hypothetical protein LBU89_08725 [Fibromonadaceae bacterium]|jgi:hypothetical protein|nr:hypothetical protein [Fibromonadaceae bacterium]
MKIVIVVCFAVQIIFAEYISPASCSITFEQLDSMKLSKGQQLWLEEILKDESNCLYLEEILNKTRENRIFLKNIEDEGYLTFRNIEKPEAIEKGRRLLLKYFLKNELNKVKEIKDSLKNIEDKNHIAFYDVEYWLILYWTNEYEELLNDVKAWDSIATKKYDMLNWQLREKSSLNARNISEQIQTAAIDAEAKDFLWLNFNAITIGFYGISQDSLNILIDDFLKTYPETEYKDYVNYIKQRPIKQEYVKPKQVLSNWKKGVDFFIGYGIFTEELSNNYTNGVPLGYGFDICYKRLELYLRGYVGFHKTKEDFEYSTGVYEKGLAISVLLFESSLGFAVINNDYFKISPFFGVGSISTDVPSEPYTKKPKELEEISMETFTYITGFNLDVGTDIFLRLRYGYVMPNFSKKYNVSGNMHYITIGLGLKVD